MRYLWLTTVAIVVSGIALVVASQTAGWGAIAFIAGVLLLWSGLVKVVVLRIWRATLTSRGVAEASTSIAATTATGCHQP